MRADNQRGDEQRHDKCNGVGGDKYKYFEGNDYWVDAMEFTWVVRDELDTNKLDVTFSLKAYPAGFTYEKLQPDHTADRGLLWYKVVRFVKKKILKLF